MRYRLFYSVATLGLIYAAWVSHFYAADEPAPKTISAKSSDLFEKQIQPLIVKTCGKCHGQKPKNSDLDLVSFGTAKAILAKPKVLADIAERLNLGDMPPKEAPQPSESERKQLLDWIKGALDSEAAARAGDPGAVTLRRLSNTEYDNAIRDLTAVDMRPTRAREFPTDSVGGEGFANVGEAMPVTPGLVERYHQAARDVAARAVLLPTGFRFSPSTERPDWAEDALKNLRSFHARYAGPNGEPPLAAHLAATLKHLDRLTRGGPAAIAEVAKATVLPRATVRRSLLTLQALGYVASDGKQFRLTPRILALGYAYLASTPLPRVN
jgi:mono/diheme cytochrome c family protein